MKAINKTKMWCYAAPDGHLQTRSLQSTKKLCRETITSQYGTATYKEYEKTGFTLHRVLVTIKEIK